VKPESTRTDCMTSHAESNTTHRVDTRDRKKGNGGQGNANSSLKFLQDVRCVMNISVRSDWLRF